MRVRNFVSFIVFSSVFLTACSAESSALSNLEYNNRIVLHINELSELVDASSNAYEVGVPYDVYADSEIDVYGMQLAYDDVKESVDYIASDLLVLESEDALQQEMVRSDLMEYWNANTEYLTAYENILEYYSGDFGSELEKVAQLDEQITDAYSKHVDTHNSLVYTLEAY